MALNQGRKEQYKKNMTGMINEQHNLEDAYLPRKCQWTNRILNAKDKSSVQLCLAQTDETGRQIKGQNETIIVSGYIRSKAEGCHAVDNILKERGFLPIQCRN